MNKVKRLYFGQYMNVYVLADEHSGSKVNNALQRLDDSMRAKLVRTLRLICETAEYRNKEKFRHEGNGIYAIKVGSLRLLGFYLPSADRKSQLVVHYYWKQSRKAPSKELKKALQMKREIEVEGYEYTE